MRTWARIFFVVRVSAAAWVALVGLYIGLQYLKVIPESTRLETVGWIVSLILIAVESVGSIVRERLQRNRVVRQEDLLRPVMGLVIQLTREPSTTLRFEDVGVSVYVPKRRSMSGADAKLKRVLRFRPSNYPQQSGIEWTGRKGTIGECWTNASTRYKDWHAIAAKWGDVEITEEAWARISKEAQQGMTRAEFSRVAGKYAEVLAVPIWHVDDDGKQIGVLTLDRTFHKDEAPFRQWLGSSQTREKVAAAAMTVGNILTSKSSSG